MTTIIIILALILSGSLCYYLFIYKLSRKEKEIIKGCIKHYEAVIQIAEVSDNWEYLMTVNCVNEGLCNYLWFKNIPKKLRKWVKRVPCSYRKFWYIIPYYCYSRDEAIEALQYRVDRMKELLQKY